MTDDTIIKLLRTCQLFESLSSEMLADVAAIARPRAFTTRESIFQAGDPCRGFYLLVDGAVKVYSLSPDGKEHVLHIIWPGQTFAEAALFLDETYPASAAAISPSRALLFPRKQFLALLSERPRFAQMLIGTLAVWLRRLVEQVEDLALRDAGSRLARYLAQINREGKATLRSSKSTIASHLGMTPETLSRLLVRLETRGLIELQGRAILISDPAAVEAIGDGKESL